MMARPGAARGAAPQAAALLFFGRRLSVRPALGGFASGRSPYATARVPRPAGRIGSVWDHVAGARALGAGQQRATAALSPGGPNTTLRAEVMRRSGRSGYKPRPRSRCAVSRPHWRHVAPLFGELAEA